MAPVLLNLSLDMDTITSIKRAAFALGLMAILGGCQSVQISHASASLDNAAFMAAWDAYRHCQLGTDVDTMRADMQQLARVAQPAQRLAADPKAMAASCALFTGQAALRAERMELASEMFRTVLKNQSQQEYAYYVEQARIGLRQVERAVQFAGSPAGAPALMTIAAPAPIDGAPVPLAD